MKLTMDRSIGTKADPGPRFALTLTVPDDDARRYEVADQDVAAALSKSLDLVQALVFPDLVATAAAFEHPQDTALFLREVDGALVRVALAAGADVENLPGLRYLPDAYNAKGKLIPVFWTLPLVDP